MREIRQSGLEGGETNMLGLPYPIAARRGIGGFATTV